MSHHTCTTDTIASSEYFVSVLFSFWYVASQVILFFSELNCVLKFRRNTSGHWVLWQNVYSVKSIWERLTNHKTSLSAAKIFEIIFICLTDKRTNRRTAASLKVTFHYVSGSLINLSWVMWYLSVTKQQFSIIIIITFISGAKPIAENRHNMKRTKIKHTNTHTNQSIEKIR